MDTILNITRLIFLAGGIFFIAFILYKYGKQNNWRFFPIQHKKRPDYRKAESRLEAKKSGKRKFTYNKGKVIIWEKSMRRAHRRFNVMTEKEKNTPTEIF